MKVSGHNADHITFVLAADEGIYGTGIQFDRHLIDL